MKSKLQAIIAATTFCFANYAEADLVQFEVRSTTYSDVCGFFVPGDDSALAFGEAGLAFNRSCFIKMDRSVFDEKFSFCALTGVSKENNPTREEVDLGGSCNMLINDERVLWSANRGTGYKEGTRGKMSCTYTCETK